jgi:hypothetical protein
MDLNTASFLQGHAMTVGIGSRALCVVRPDADVCLACVGGTLWVTLDHDLRDIILEPGQHWTIPARKRCLIYALQASHACLTAANACTQAAQR